MQSRVDGVDPDSNAGKAISVLVVAQKQLESKSGGSVWKDVKRGYDETSDGLAHLKDSSWHFLHEMIPDDPAGAGQNGIEIGP